MAWLFDRILNRKPPLDKPRSDSGRAHVGGFLDEDELNSDLRGRAGLQIYDKMYRGDHDIRRNVAMAVNPLVGATWSTEPFGGDQATDEDKQIADDFAWALGLGDYVANTPNRTPWAAHLAEFLPVLIRSGFAPGELEWGVAERDGRKLITLRRIGLRLPRTIHRWITRPEDLNNDLLGAGWGTGSLNGDELLALEHYRASVGDYVLLPRQDLVYYRLGIEGDNWEGISLLRPAYKAWYIKDKIERLDAQGIEREAVGLPVVFPPKGGATTPEQLNSLEEKLGLLRRGELAYLIMPGPSAETDTESGWTFKIEGLGGAGSGGKRDAQPSLQYWRDAISAAFVQEFMRLGQGGGGSKGAMSTAEVQDDPFAAAVTAMAVPIIAEALQVIARRFVTLNYGADKPIPGLTMSLSEGDLAALVTFVSDLVTAQVLFPDDELEDFMRQRGKLPPADKAAREERKAQQEEARQAELEAGKAGPAVVEDGLAVGEDGDHQAVTETSKPDGTKTVKRETKRTRARALEDAPLTLDTARKGAMIALYPPPGQARDLALDGGEPAEQLHITLAYLGDADQITDPARLRQLVAGWAASTPAITGSVSGHGVFTAGDEPVTYLSIDIPGLEPARDRLTDLLAAGGYPPSREHGFTPHITLAYQHRPGDVGARTEPLLFTDIALVLAGERQPIKLTGPVALDDPASGPRSARDASALQITTPMAGERHQRCEKCGERHHPDHDCPRRLDTQPRSWEQIMPIQALDDTMTASAAAVHDAALPHVRAIAAAAAAAVIAGETPSDEIPDEMQSAITSELARAAAAGRASVIAEIAGQRTDTLAVLDEAEVKRLAADLPPDGIARRGWLAAKAIVAVITQAVAGRHADGTTNPADLAAAGELAGDAEATRQGRGHAPAAVNEGREDAALEHADMIRGSRYTSILDRNRCEVCAQADDGVLRRLDDPVRVQRRPPNLSCRSIASGINRCRCMEFYELNDEAPAYLDSA